MTVMPLRSEAQLADMIGTRAPVAIVTVKDPEIDRRRREVNLRRRFGLTAAESMLAAEILKGDGRVAAARRRGISGGPLKPSSQAFSRRPEPTGRPNSSASCSTKPTGIRWKHE